MLNETADLVLEDSRYVLKGKVKSVSVGEVDDYLYQYSLNEVPRAKRYTISAEFVPNDEDVAYRIYEKELTMEALRTVSVIVKNKSLKECEAARVRVGAPEDAEFVFNSKAGIHSVTFSWRENV